VEATRAAIAEVQGIETQLSTSGGTSDGRFIAPLGAQVVELGPINASIHQVDEHVGVEELDRLSAIYRRHPRAAAGPRLSRRCSHGNARRAGSPFHLRLFAFICG
jgi:acetylornithine deacetylase/succinyl-diaminopimelate desuccinylase-like protein